MTLTWVAVVVAAVALTLCVTANIVVGPVYGGGHVPDLVNLLSVATAGSAVVLAVATAGSVVVLAVVADLHDRLNERITALTEFLIARLNELDADTGDRKRRVRRGLPAQPPTGARGGADRTSDAGASGGARQRRLSVSSHTFGRRVAGVR